MIATNSASRFIVDCVFYEREIGVGLERIEVLADFENGSLYRRGTALY